MFCIAFDSFNFEDFLFRINVIDYLVGQQIFFWRLLSFLLIRDACCGLVIVEASGVSLIVIGLNQPLPHRHVEQSQIRPRKHPYEAFFIGPTSDHSLCMSATPSLTDYLLELE